MGWESKPRQETFIQKETKNLELHSLPLIFVCGHNTSNSQLVTINSHPVCTSPTASLIILFKILIVYLFTLSSLFSGHRVSKTGAKRLEGNSRSCGTEDTYIPSWLRQQPQHNHNITMTAEHFSSILSAVQ